MKKKLNYFDELWQIETNYYYHKLPDFIEKGGEKRIEYREVIPVYVYQKNIWWNGKETVDIGPVDYSKPENKDVPWRWKRELNESDIGKTVFRTKEEAEAKYMELPEEKRKQYEEIKQLKRLSN